MEVLIKNYSVPQEPIIANRISIRVVDIVFGKSAKFSVDFYYDITIVKINVIVDITEQEYKQWGTDDQYIIKLICSKLGIANI
jgi:hypothetical protein